MKAPVAGKSASSPRGALADSQGRWVDDVLVVVEVEKVGTLMVDSWMLRTSGHHGSRSHMCMAVAGCFRAWVLVALRDQRAKGVFEVARRVVCVFRPPSCTPHWHVSIVYSHGLLGDSARRCTEAVVCRTDACLLILDEGVLALVPLDISSIPQELYALFPCLRELHLQTIG